MRVLLYVGFALLTLGWTSAASAQPPKSERIVDYQRDVRPILAQACHACHGPAKSSGGLRVDSVAALLQGGRSGPAIVPSKGAASLLVKKSDEADPTPHKGRVLTPEQTSLLKSWIDQGARTADTRPAGVVEVDLSKLPPELAREIIDALNNRSPARPK
jgi:hypothetical protein